MNKFIVPQKNEFVNHFYNFYSHFMNFRQKKVSHGSKKTFFTIFGIVFLQFWFCNYSFFIFIPISLLCGTPKKSHSSLQQANIGGTNCNRYVCQSSIIVRKTVINLPIKTEQLSRCSPRIFKLHSTIFHLCIFSLRF